MARGNRTDKRSDSKNLRRKKCESDSDSEESIGSTDTYSEEEDCSTEEEEEEEETESSEESNESDESDDSSYVPKKDISEKKIR